MKEASASRVAADLCWFYMLFFLFAPAKPALWLTALFTAACLPLGFWAPRFDRAALRALCVLPALALCLLAPDTATRAALGAGWVYFALVFVPGRFEMEHWAYRRVFYAMCAVALLIAFYVFAAQYAVPSLSAGGVPHSGRVHVGVAVFGGTFALLGIYTLRAIRIGVSTDFGWKAYSALELALPAAAGGALFALLRFLFLHLETVFTVLFSPFALLFRLIVDLLSLLSHGEDMGPIGGPVTEAAPPEAFDPPSEGSASPTAEPTEVHLPEMAPIPWGKILLALAFFAALVLLALYLRQGKRIGEAAAERIAEERFQPFRRRRRSPPPKNHAERVRRCYAAYLQLLELHGQVIGDGDTSLDVLNAPERPADVSEEERMLRRLYLVARYGDDESVSAADADAAERCLDAIRVFLQDKSANDTF